MEDDTETQSEPRTTNEGSEALYFRFIGECLGQAPNIPDKPGHIYFGIAGNSIPTEVLKIQDAVEHTAEILRRLYQDSRTKEFKELFQELLSAAQLLAGPKPGLVVTAAQVLRIQEKVVLREGKGIKSAYLNILGRHIAVSVSMLLIVALVSAVWSDTWAEMNLSMVTFLPYLMVLLSTATAAIWLSFASRKPHLSFDDLLAPEGDMMGTWHRIVYVGLFTAVLGLFSAAEMVSVSIGNFSTELIFSDYLSAAIFGFVCGFSEKLLSSTVSPHVTAVISGLGKTPQ
jgi:hypothetical protein